MKTGPDEKKTVLREYAEKRKFGDTPEPAPAMGPVEGRLRFVVHKHAASALHYDLRLELEGVLKSWALPKGPTLDPKIRRLAVMVEDHPLDYREFEGVIPEGNYGAGAAIIWDRGFYGQPQAKSGERGEGELLAGLAKGDLKFVLEGEKLKGEFALVKTGKDGKSWLLLKKKDAYATTEDVLSQRLSVASGRSVEDLLSSVPETPFVKKKTEALRAREALEGEELSAAPMAPMPRNVRPMLASTARQPFDDPEWIFEVKWDGYRAIAEVEGGRAKLYSRNLKSLDEKFGPVREALKGLHFSALFDGEVVAVDDKGVPDFQFLQNSGAKGEGFLLYCIFDLLHFQGRDLTGLPLHTRKAVLKRILPQSPRLRYSDHVKGGGILFFKAARAKGLEGVVAKEARSTYQIGRRSAKWLKVKSTRTQDAVIAGFTAPRGSRSHFGTLVLGVYNNGALVFIGHSGGGFGDAELRELHARLLPLAQEGCPFSAVPASNAPVTWVKPELVCEVSFTGWTREGLLRHPVFLRLREDKSAAETEREVF